MALRDSLPVLIDGRRYNIDVARLARSTIDPIRQGFDTQGTPGEQSLNQAGVWKRSRNNWDLGTGQREGDTDQADGRRFYASTGVDVWTRNELKLLKTVTRVSSTANTNLYMATATSSGTARLYYCSSADVVYSGDAGSSWAGITNPAGGVIDGIASDGANIYVASSAGGEVQKIAGISIGTTENTDYWTIAADGVWVANGYLLASVGSRLTQLSPGSAPSTNNDVSATAFDQVDTWKSVIGTPAGIYAAGVQGDMSRIYYVGINDSTTGLLNPVIAAELPQGETVNVLSYYGGLLCIGTSKGIRLGAITGDGFVTYGPRIDISGGTEAFEPQGEFVWFGWSNYDSPFDATSRSGLGRLGLSEFTASLVPAYATDLMASGETGTVQGAVTNVNGIRLFSVSGDGVWAEASTFETTGTIDSGRLRWGTTELKAPVSADVRHTALAASETVVVKLLGDDDSTETTVITSDVDTETTPGLKQVTGVTGEYVSTRVTMTGPGGSTPTVRRWTIRAIPMPYIAEIIQLPILLSTYTDWDDRHVFHDTYDDYVYLKQRMENRTLVSFTMGSETQTVYVAGIAYEAGGVAEWTDDRKWFDGTLTVTLMTVQGT